LIVAGISLIPSRLMRIFLVHLLSPLQLISFPLLKATTHSQAILYDSTNNHSPTFSIPLKPKKPPRFSLLVLLMFLAFL